MRRTWPDDQRCRAVAARTGERCEKRAHYEGFCFKHFPGYAAPTPAPVAPAPPSCPPVPKAIGRDAYKKLRVLKNRMKKYNKLGDQARRSADAILGIEDPETADIEDVSINLWLDQDYSVDQALADLGMVVADEEA